jgi:ATP-binding cassette subfamily B protein
VLSSGRVVESGSHAELLAAGGAYAQLWSLQHASNEAAAESVA